MLRIEDVVGELFQPPSLGEWRTLSQRPIHIAIRDEIAKTVLARSVNFRGQDGKCIECKIASGRIFEIQGQAVSSQEDLSCLDRFHRETEVVEVRTEVLDQNEITGNGDIWSPQIEPSVAKMQCVEITFAPIAEITFTNGQEKSCLGEPAQLKILREIHRAGLATKTGEDQFAAFSNDNPEEPTLVVFEVGAELTLLLCNQQSIETIHAAWRGTVRNRKNTTL